MLVLREQAAAAQTGLPVCGQRRCFIFSHTDRAGRWIVNKRIAGIDNVTLVFRLRLYDVRVRRFPAISLKEKGVADDRHCQIDLVQLFREHSAPALGLPTAVNRFVLLTCAYNQRMHDIFTRSEAQRPGGEVSSSWRGWEKNGTAISACVRKRGSERTGRR